MNTTTLNSSRLMTLAFALSLLAHILVWWGIHKVGAGFSAPVVHPHEPARFNVQRSTIDPRSIEQPTRTPVSTRDIEFDPSQIATFSGPLNAPHIPIPRIQSETPMPLSAGSAPQPVQAFSALPLEMEGNLPQAAQALAQEASTAALHEVSQFLGQGSLAGGVDQATREGVPNLPKFEEISELLPTRTGEVLQRPAFQPILLRLSSDVLFEFDSAKLQPSAFDILQQISIALQNAVRVEVTIEGHTDTFGEDAYNQRLSEQRAQAVADWMKNVGGLTNKKIKVQGFGKSRPIANPNGSVEEQAPNRRVELRIEAER